MHAWPRAGSLVSERRQTPVRSRAVEEYALVFISVSKA